MSKKLEKLIQKQEQIANRVKQERAKQKGRERKDLTRRKVLLGALAMAMMEQDPDFRTEVEKRLEGFLTRKLDREVFSLAGGTGPSSSGVDSESQNESAAQ
jgi:hypothetical protein